MSANIRIIATITSLFLTAWSLLVSNSTVAQPQTSNPVIVATLDGAIGPASEDHLARILSQAQQSNAQLVVLQLNTPGGLDSAMRTMVADILASPVPVVTWVTPSGARAASAGTYILMASHVAAMAPATNTGSSTPVAGGGGGTSF